MRRIYTIAAITIRLARRNGTLWGILAAVSITAAVIFFGSHGDETLINELKLRIQYSYSITYRLLSFIMIVVACFTIRSQIDARQIHTLTSLPITRREIWLGKWLGLLSIAAVAIANLILVVTVCAVLYSRSYSDDERASAKRFFFVARQEVFPEQPDLDKLTDERLQAMVRDGQLAAGEVSATKRTRVYRDVRRELQRVPAHGEQSWIFELGGRPQHTGTVNLVFRVHAAKKRELITGSWFFSEPGRGTSYQSTFEIYPYTRYVLPGPADAVPESGRLKLTLRSTHDSDLFISRRGGVRIHYHDVRVRWNIIQTAVLQIIHMGTVVAVGLMTGVAFTFAPAAFLAVSLFVLSAATSLFTITATDLARTQSQTFLDLVGIGITRVGIWLGSGLTPPDAIENLSTGIVIPLAQLVTGWLPVTVLYGLAAACIGITLLARKELDKILT